MIFGYLNGANKLTKSYLEIINVHVHKEMIVTNPYQHLQKQDQVLQQPK